MKNGIPFDLAMALDDETAIGWSIRFGIFAGGEFDFVRKDWVRRDA